MESLAALSGVSRQVRDETPEALPRSKLRNGKSASHSHPVSRQPNALRCGRRGHGHRQFAPYLHYPGNSTVAEFSPEVPFWPQLPQISEQESIVAQGLGVVRHLIEPRREGYGYTVKEGQLDSVLEVLHRSSGELSPANAAGFAGFEEALLSGVFPSAVAVKGQIEGPITLSAYLFYHGRPFLSDPHFLPPSLFTSHKSSAGK